MSYNTIAQSVKDGVLIDRIRAAIAKEVYGNPTFGDTQYGQAVKSNTPDVVLQKLLWPICIDNEAAYATALVSENPNPGGDEAVITDGNLGSGVQAHWPSDS